MSNARLPKVWLVEQPCVLVFPDDGRIVHTAIRLSSPKTVASTAECDNFESSCWLQLDGVLDLAGPLIGASTLHVLCVALGFLAKTLNDLHLAGVRLEDEHGHRLQLIGAKSIVITPQTSAVLACHYVISVSNSGVRRHGMAGIGELVMTPENQWRSAIISDGIDPLEESVFSDSPLACLIAAIEVLSARMAQRLGDGWRFLEPYDGCVIDIHELFVSKATDDLFTQNGLE